MIAYIRGELVSKGRDSVVVDNGGIGYKIYVPRTTLNELCSTGIETILFTYLHVREDEMSLYGFGAREDLQLFELLLGVSGIGPKMALNICSDSGSAEVYTAILSNDIKVLTKIKGIGKKTAQRMILELKEKIASLQTDVVEGACLTSTEMYQVTPTGGVANEAFAALQALGYDFDEATSALKVALDAVGEDATVEKLVKYALKSLSVL